MRPALRSRHGKLSLIGKSIIYYDLHLLGGVGQTSTEAGTYRTEQVIIAAGPWSAALARLAGLELPIVPVLHEYFVTEPVPGWHAGLPCLRIPEVQVSPPEDPARARGVR